MKSKVLKISASVISGIVVLVLGAMMIIPSIYKDEIIDAALKVAGENLDARIDVKPENINFSLFSSFVICPYITYPIVTESSSRGAITSVSPAWHLYTIAFRIMAHLWQSSAVHLSHRAESFSSFSSNSGESYSKCSHGSSTRLIMKLSLLPLLRSFSTLTIL